MRKITINDLPDWLNSKEKAAIYHVGFLASDRDGHYSKLKLEERKTLDVLANVLWKMADRKLIHLVQRKNSENEYVYMAIKDSSLDKNFKLEDV